MSQQRLTNTFRHSDADTNTHTNTQWVGNLEIWRTMKSDFIVLMSRCSDTFYQSVELCRRLLLLVGTHVNTPDINWMCVCVLFHTERVRGHLCAAENTGKHLPLQFTSFCTTILNNEDEFYRHDRKLETLHTESIKCRFSFHRVWFCFCVILFESHRMRADWGERSQSSSSSSSRVRQQLHSLHSLSGVTDTKTSY